MLTRFFFQGTLQDVRLVSGPHGYLAQCPGLDSECPTCGQFALLQATVQELTTHIHDLSLKVWFLFRKHRKLIKKSWPYRARCKLWVTVYLEGTYVNYYKVDCSLQLVGAEARLARLEQCDCQKSCFINGTALPDGSTWEKDCNHCTCKVRIYNTRISLD